MQKQTTQQTFFHRNFYPSSRHSIPDLPKTPLLIDPPNIQISNYTFDKISVAKLNLTNEFKVPRKFTMTLPRRSSNFSIQCPEKQVPGRNSIELFIWFNPQKEKEKIVDELVIKVQSDPTQIHIPIVCFPKLTIGKTDSSRIICSKENIQRSQQRISRRPNPKSRKHLNKNSIFLPSGPLQTPEINSNQSKDPRHQAILEFQQNFRNIFDYVREKYVKNQVYLGAHKITKQKIHQIQIYHSQVQKSDKQRLHQEVTNRFQTKYLTEGPISNSPIECSVSWNIQRNIPSITFELGMNKIQEEVRKYVVSMRFQRIKTSLRFFQKYRQKEQELGRKFKITQYIDVHSQKVKQSKVVNDYELEFDRNSLKPTFLPVEPEFKTFYGGFEVTQRVGFDNWVPINITEPGHWQYFNQKEIQIPAFSLHYQQLLNDHKNGGSQEMRYRQNNQTLSTDFDSLMTIVQDCMEGDQKRQFKEELSINLFKNDYEVYFDISQQEEPQTLNQQECMELGPLHPLRSKRPYASIDLFGLQKAYL